MLKFACPKCEKGLKTDESNAGKKVQCTRCGQKMRLPKSKDYVEKLFTSADIIFPCGYCRKENESEPECVGQLVKCKECAKEIIVPRYFSDEIPFPDPILTEEQVLVKERELEQKLLWYVSNGPMVVSDHKRELEKMLEEYLYRGTPFNEDKVINERIRAKFLDLHKKVICGKICPWCEKNKITGVYWNYSPHILICIICKKEWIVEGG